MTKYNSKEYQDIKEFDKERLYIEAKTDKTYKVHQIFDTYLILKVVSDDYTNGFSRKVSKKVFLKSFK